MPPSLLPRRLLFINLRPVSGWVITRVVSLFRILLPRDATTRGADTPVQSGQTADTLKPSALHHTTARGNAFCGNLEPAAKSKQVFAKC